MKPGSMPGVEAVGDDVARLAYTFQACHRGQLRADGSGRQNRCVQRFLAADLVEADPHQHAIVVAGQRFPAEFPAALQSQPVPRADQSAAHHPACGQIGSQMRARGGSDVQVLVIVTPGDDLDSADRRPERPVAAHIGAGAEHEPISAGTTQRALQRAIDDGRFSLLVGGLLVSPVDFW